MNVRGTEHPTAQCLNVNTNSNAGMPRSTYTSKFVEPHPPSPARMATVRGRYPSLVLELTPILVSLAVGAAAINVEGRGRGEEVEGSEAATTVRLMKT
jgi:hypothetical protein